MIQPTALPIVLSPTLAAAPATASDGAAFAASLALMLDLPASPEQPVAATGKMVPASAAPGAFALPRTGDERDTTAPVTDMLAPEAAMVSGTQPPVALPCVTKDTDAPAQGKVPLPDVPSRLPAVPIVQTPQRTADVPDPATPGSASKVDVVGRLRLDRQVGIGEPTPAARPVIPADSDPVPADALRSVAIVPTAEKPPVIPAAASVVVALATPVAVEDQPDAVIRSAGDRPSSVALPDALPAMATPGPVVSAPPPVTRTDDMPTTVVARLPERIRAAPDRTAPPAHGIARTPERPVPTASDETDPVPDETPTVEISAPTPPVAEPIMATIVSAAPAPPVVAAPFDTERSVVVARPTDRPTTGAGADAPVASVTPQPSLATDRPALPAKEPQAIAATPHDSVTPGPRRAPAPGDPRPVPALTRTGFTPNPATPMPTIAGPTVVASAATVAVPGAPDRPEARRIRTEPPGPPIAASAPQAMPVVAGVTAPAFRLFAAAIHAARRDERIEASAPSLLPATSVDQTRVSQIAAVADSTILDTTTPHWPQHMVDRIESLRDAASAMRDAASTSIRLVPDALGTIDVSVRTDGDTVHVHFSAEQAATRTLITDAQPRLTELADAKGIKLTQGEVGNGSAGGEQRQSAGRPTLPDAPPSAVDDNKPETATIRVA